METQGWYTVSEFAPDSFMIQEGGRFRMHLFLGRERALAVDGGIGFADLRRLYESITPLPITFVVSHTHWDHLGCAHQFESVGAHPRARDALASIPTDGLRAFLKEWGERPFPEGFDPASFVPRPVGLGWAVREGTLIDLGGRRFTAYETPGHTPDSICLLDDREGVFVSGDMLRPFNVVHLQGEGAVLSDYRRSLRKVEPLAPRVKWITSGHTDPFGDASIIKETADFLEEIEEGKHEPTRVELERWGAVDEYEAPRFRVWVGDRARR